METKKKQKISLNELIKRQALYLIYFNPYDLKNIKMMFKNLVEVVKEVKSSRGYKGFSVELEGNEIIFNVPNKEVYENVKAIVELTLNITKPVNDISLKQFYKFLFNDRFNSAIIKSGFDKFNKLIFFNYEFHVIILENLWGTAIDNIDMKDIIKADSILNNSSID